MPSTVKEVVRVNKLTKFGFQIGDEFVNYSKMLPEGDKTKVVPGAEFEAELYVADSGKRYLNKILSGALSPAKAVAAQVSLPKADTEQAKRFTPKFQKKEDTASGSTSMSKAEWQAKDRSQLIGGLSHDAAAVTASLVNVMGGLSEPAEALALYKKLLEGMITIREELK